MKTFLRDMANLLYYQSLETWTPDRDHAYDFRVVSEAMRVAQKLRVPNLELVLSLDDPQHVGTATLGRVLRGHPHLRKPRMAGARA